MKQIRIKKINQPITNAYYTTMSMLTNIIITEQSINNTALQLIIHLINVNIYV